MIPKPEKISTSLKNHINEDGQLMLDAVKTRILLSWIINAEKILSESHQFIEDIQQMLKITANSRPLADSNQDDA